MTWWTEIGEKELVASVSAYGATQDAFAGHVVQHSPPRVIAFFADDPARHEAALRERMDRRAENSWYLSVRQVRWSLRDLTALLDRLEYDEIELLNEGIADGASCIDIGDNAVVLELWRPTDEQLAWLAARYGEALRVHRYDVDQRIPCRIAAFEPVGASSIEVRYQAYSGGQGPHEVIAREGTDTIELAVFGLTPPWQTGEKIPLIIHRERVDLSAPIGRRRIIAMQPDQR